MPYTPMQQKYIDSVDGRAHQSAVEIIGELEEMISNQIINKTETDQARKIIQIAESKVATTALCNDGSVWREMGEGWKRLPDIPQD